MRNKNKYIKSNTTVLRKRQMRKSDNARIARKYRKYCDNAMKTMFDIIDIRIVIKLYL